MTDLKAKGNMVSLMTSFFGAFGSGLMAGDTGLVLRNGQPEFLLGCIGANIHPQGQLQTMVNVLELGMNPLQAVDAPRFRVGMTNDQVSLEAEFPESVRRDLEARGHPLGTAPDVMGAAQMVRIHRGEDGIAPCLECGVDHRLDGVALGW
jgi:gamma-glutamyltranspeptidase / glutathione hydrolase